MRVLPQDQITADRFLYHGATVATRLLRTTTTPFWTAWAAASSDVHIAVAHAGDDDPLGAIVNAGINKVRRRLR